MSILLFQVHAYIISSLKKDMPSVFGKEGKKKELIKNLDGLYSQLQREHQISPGDFPDIAKMQELLANQDFTKFRTMDVKLLERVDRWVIRGMFPDTVIIMGLCQDAGGGHRQDDGHDSSGRGD